MKTKEKLKSELIEIFWKHSTNIPTKEVVIPFSEVDEILTEILYLINQEL